MSIKLIQSERNFELIVGKIFHNVENGGENMEVIRQVKENEWRLADGSLAEKFEGSYYVFVGYPTVINTDEMEFGTYEELLDYAEKVYNNEVHIRLSDAHQGYMAGVEYEDDTPDERGLSLKERLNFWSLAEEEFGSFALGRLFKYKQLLGLVA